MAGKDAALRNSDFRCRLSPPARRTLNVSRLADTGGMAETDSKPYGRSLDRSAAVVVRMSAAERQALNAAAEAHGQTVTDLMRSRVSDLIGATR